MFLLLLSVYIKEWSDFVSSIVISRSSFFFLPYSSLLKVHVRYMVLNDCPSTWFPSPCHPFAIFYRLCSWFVGRVARTSYRLQWLAPEPSSSGWSMSLGKSLESGCCYWYYKWYGGICVFCWGYLGSDQNCPFEVLDERINLVSIW